MVAGKASPFLWDLCSQEDRVRAGVEAKLKAKRTGFVSHIYHLMIKLPILLE
jgi:hypothetical protein